MHTFFFFFPMVDGVFYASIQLEMLPFESNGIPIFKKYNCLGTYRAIKLALTECKTLD